MKQNKTSILSGLIETGISSTLVDTKNSFITCLKIQFTEVSYHFNKKNFAFKISYFWNDDLKKPVLTLLSPNFIVFARKPNQTTTKKRKRSEDGNTDNNGELEDEIEENEENEGSSLIEFNTKFSDFTEKLMKINDLSKRKEHMVCF